MNNTVEQEKDKPELRAEADSIRLGQIPQNTFSGLMDNAVTHATSTVAADGQAATRPWRNLGPRNIGGRIRTLAIDPRDGGILYAGSALGGVWKTTDAGDSWTPVDDFRPPNGARQALPIGALAVSHSDPQTVYAGTGEPVTGYISGNGLFRSRNGGRHFTQIDHPDTGVIRAKHYERIRVDPWQPLRLWCASPDRGLWRGRPGGAFVQDVIDAAGAPAAGAQRATDVVINTGDPRATAPARFTVFVALSGAGVYRATFIRASDRYDTTGATTWTRVNIPGLDALPGFRRIKLALCKTRPTRMYCVAEIAGGARNKQFSPVFTSVNSGVNWTATEGQPGSTSTITWYSLVLECSPVDPHVVFLGQVDMWCSKDGGKTWGTAATTQPPNFNPCLDRTKYGLGDRAQHADQQAVVFDRQRPHHVWVANDGGVSLTTNLGKSWIKRSHGILATQFDDISTHPTYPFMMGGGLQDNGCWMTYGGLSWYNIGHSDGGDIGFEPGNPRLFHVSAQQGVWRGQMATQLTPSGFSRPNPAPDIPLSVNATGMVNSHGQFITDVSNGVATADKPPFYGVVVHHPTRNNEALIGRRNNAYRTTNGTQFTVLGHNAFNNHGATNSEVSALAYGPSPGFDWWVGTSRGEIFVRPGGTGAWRNATEPLACRGNWISAIATHPTNTNIAAIAVASNPGTVYVTGNRGQNWFEISGRAGVAAGNWLPRATPNASDRLNPGPATAVAFDPASPNSAASAQTLYVGTLTGVYVIRNVMVPVAAPLPNFQPAWRTFNNNLPLVLVYEMETVRFADSAGTTHSKLRIATFGRGIYEVDLTAASATRLLVRNHIADNGLALPAGNTLTQEPRLPPGTALVNDQSIDVRVDAPSFLYFGQVADSVEFDQVLRSEALLAGELNLVYVQVHNVGSRASDRVTVSLYWAQATGTPRAAPNLPANFWTGFPRETAPPWTRVATREVTGIVSGSPAVVRFEWDVPCNLPTDVALLVLVSDAARDRLDSPAPATNIMNLVTAERRAALRVTTSLPAAARLGLIRDGFDDQGHLGETAWGARSHDIIVVQRAVVGGTEVVEVPNVAFADANDRRQSDRLKGGGKTNHIYIRLNNKRCGQSLNNVRVELFRIPLSSVSDPNSWVSLGVSSPINLTPRTVGFAGPINWNTATDPAPHKVYLLAALLRADGIPAPNHRTGVSSIKSFWRLFVEAADSGNAVLRGIRWEA